MSSAMCSLAQLGASVTILTRPPWVHTSFLGLQHGPNLHTRLYRQDAFLKHTHTQALWDKCQHLDVATGWWEIPLVQSLRGGAQLELGCVILGSFFVALSELG